MSDDRYDGHDGDPQADDGFARLDALLGLSPPQPGPRTEMTPQQFDELFARALVIADADLGPKRHTSRRRLLGWLAATAATAAAGVIAVVTVEATRPQAAHGATPPPLTFTPSPRGAPLTLTELALAAQRGSGARTAVDHLVIDSWDYDSYIGDRKVTSVVIPSRRELWRADDDHARTIKTYFPPQFPTDADRQAWHDDGSPRGGPPVDETYPRDGLPVIYRGRPPRDPEILAGWLAQSHTGSAAILKGVMDLLRERALTGPECSAVLRVLATRTPLAYAGTTVDRAGRAGIAFTATTTDSGGDVTLVFVIDPRTGRILATEKILTAGAPRWDVQRPAVISYRTYLVAEQVPAIPSA